MAGRIATLGKRFGDVLMMSYRPTQLILSACAFGMFIVFCLDSFMDNYSYFKSALGHTYNIAAAFFVYGALSLHCSLTLSRTNAVIITRYITVLLGLMLWSIGFILEAVSTTTNPTLFLHLFPIFAEVWILAQLLSNIRVIDRRAL